MSCNLLNDHYSDLVTVHKHIILCVCVSFHNTFSTADCVAKNCMLIDV
jgi:hypothetical protein